jgi:hypothetical protein
MTRLIYSVLIRILFPLRIIKDFFILNILLQNVKFPELECAWLNFVETVLF